VLIDDIGGQPAAPRDGVRCGRHVERSPEIDEDDPLEDFALRELRNLHGAKVTGMEKKLTNSSPLMKSTSEHSIYTLLYS